MPDIDGPSRSGAPDAPPENRNLPVPVPPAKPFARENGDSWMGRLLRSIFGWKSGTIRAGLADVLATSDFSLEERTMLKNILSLRERRAEDIMVPRADIVAVQQEITLGELMKVFENAAHSRLVVYNDTLDDPVGMVHIRDLLAFMTARAAVAPQANPKRKKPLPAGLDLKAINLSMPLIATKIIRANLFVPPSMSAIDLLAKMQATHIHLALVIDEYGGTDGLVSIEDIVEEVVGQIEDEHDEPPNHNVVEQPDGSYLADARASLEKVTATIGVEFDVGEATEEVDTLGGYLFMQVGRVPVRGEVVPGPGPFEIEVLDADPRRVKRVKIYRSKQRQHDLKTRRRELEADIEARSAANKLASGDDAASASPPEADAAKVRLRGARRP
ncbi:MAG: HlyC/CorC family transporter [Bradyrhizobiaceae bacterium]|nr:HlyC/CorC family transporter [Bradyrhizobiaceae bacterium]